MFCFFELNVENQYINTIIVVNPFYTFFLGIIREFQNQNLADIKARSSSVRSNGGSKKLGSGSLNLFFPQIFYPWIFFFNP